MNSEHMSAEIISDAEMAVLRKSADDGLKLAIRLVRDFYEGTLPIDVVNDVIDRFFDIDVDANPAHTFHAGLLGPCF